ncbi:MAG: O-antigen ligase family protein [Chthoniobacterales bacterium]
MLLCFYSLCIASTVFIILMLATASRGAVVALAFGLFAIAISLVVSHRAFSILTVFFSVGRKRYFLPVVGILLILIGTILFAPIGKRFSTIASTEGSTNSRLEIYKVFPAMLVAAPFGWGKNNAAFAYQNYFQAFNDTRRYKHLLSSHVTWLVEHGTLFRVLYIFTWLLIFYYLFKSSPVALGIWVVFGVAALFSHVAGDWRLWILPVISLLLVISKDFYQQKSFPLSCKKVFILAATASGILLSLVVVGHLTNKDKISFKQEKLLINIITEKQATTWFLFPDTRILGESYGKKLR